MIGNFFQSLDEFQPAISQAQLCIVWLSIWFKCVFLKAMLVYYCTSCSLVLASLTVGLYEPTVSSQFQVYPLNSSKMTNNFFQSLDELQPVIFSSSNVSCPVLNPVQICFLESYPCVLLHFLFHGSCILDSRFL